MNDEDDLKRCRFFRCLNSHATGGHDDVCLRMIRLVFLNDVINGIAMVLTKVTVIEKFSV